MLKRIHLNNFKSFESTTLEVGSFTVLVGPNGSGKSNIRDAFHFIHGIGRRYTLSDIIGGKYGAGGQSEWSQMRGAAGELVRFGQKSFSLVIKLSINKTSYQYDIQVERAENLRTPYVIVAEALSPMYGDCVSDPVYTSNPAYDDPVALQNEEDHLLLRMAKSGGSKRFGKRVSVRPDQPALTQLPEASNVTRAQKDIIEQVIEQFASIRFLDPIPEQMRQPSFPGQTVLGDAGDNLPTVLQEICAAHDRKAVLLDWLRELTPLDVVDFDFPVNPVTGHVQLALRERNGNTISAYSASDGTLRFLAMLAALLGANPALLYFFEEIDNGIHPTRLRLLIDLIEGQTKKGQIQVVTTTHSPELLSMLGSETFLSTSTVHRQSDGGGSVIKLVSDLSDNNGLSIRERLGELHASGWIENVMHFNQSE